MTTEEACSGCTDYALSRRRFLQAAGLTAGTTLSSMALGGVFRQVSAAESTAEHAGNVLVVLSLRGGADGLSLLVPYGDPAYYAARPRIAVPKSQLLAADGFFGLHPALAPLMPLWQHGRLTAVHAVGLPQPNRSHFAAMEEVEDADPGSSARTGWLNRLVGLDGGAASPYEAVNIGSFMVPTSLMGPQPTLGFSRPDQLRLPGAKSPSAQASWKRRSLDVHWRRAPGPLGRAARNALRATAQLPDELAEPARTDAAYPKGPLGDALCDTARLIAAGTGTRIITLDYGSWDMHTDLGTLASGSMLNRATELAEGLAAFYTDLGELAEKVTVVTASEFGRRVAENGSGGLDHGYGNMMLLMGGGVKGGRFHATWPGLGRTALLDGDLAVTRDYRSVLTEVVRARFGVDSSKVFPNFSAEAPLGLFTA